MIIQSVPAGPFATNAYVIGCPEAGKAAIIDPGVESAKEIIQIIEEMHLTAEKILLTHSHWDHIGDVAQLKEKWNIPVHIHELDKGNLEKPGSDGLPLWQPIEPTTADQYLSETVDIGNSHWKILHTPGHTPGGVCLYNEKNKILISGDTLFKGSIGNLSFPTADPEAMWISLEKLATLPSDTKVYPGHGEPTTIGAESWLSEAKQLFGN